jgi:hypothetical protein
MPNPFKNSFKLFMSLNKFGISKLGKLRFGNFNSFNLWVASVPRVLTPPAVVTLTVDPCAAELISIIPAFCFLFIR